MAPPTRHSTRLGNATSINAGASTAKKEDENAGAIKLPTTRTLRGRTALSAAGTTSKLNGKPVSTATSTTNLRKRILDDRTNKVTSFTNSNNTTNNKLTTTKPLPGARKPASRRAATTEMVLEDVPINEHKVVRPIKPLKRAAATSNETLKRTNSTTTTNGKKKMTTTNTNIASHSVAVKVPTGGTALRASSRRTSGRVNKTTIETSVVEERATKKARTSEPEMEIEGEKENMSLDDEVEQEEEIKKVVKNKTQQRKRSEIEVEVEEEEMVGVDGEKLKEGEEGWEDLDEGDEEDPLMVKEYVNEIYHYMRELELETLPDPNYMSRQNELTWKMRGVLVDWIVEVHCKFRLLPETLFLAINLMDRFLTKRTVALIKFQLVGVTALFLASKYEEVICPSVSNFLYMTDGGYDNEEILKAETYMLEMLNWDLRYPNPLNFLRRVSKADHYDIQSRTFAKYFMEISVVDYRLISTVPSLLAAASIWLSRKLLKRGKWDSNLVHYSGYSQKEILPTAQLMLDYILRSGCKSSGMGLEPNFIGIIGYEGGNEHNNLFKKYATRKFFRVSELVREWAIDLYTFETPTGWEWDKLEEWNEQ